MLAVEQFVLTEESLRLDYLVTNASEHDIWVCTSRSDVAPDPRSSAETLICGETLQVRRRCNLEQHLFVNAPLFYAVYSRLTPGMSRSDTVLLRLPVRNISLSVPPKRPVYPIVLNRVVFESGYFSEDLRSLLPEEDRARPYRVYANGYFHAPDTAFIPYVIPHKWDKLYLEHFVQVTFSDVIVPGRLPGNE
jgi:hypothetical protein